MELAFAIVVPLDFPIVFFFFRGCFEILIEIGDGSGSSGGSQSVMGSVAQFGSGAEAHSSCAKLNGVFCGNIFFFPSSRLPAGVFRGFDLGAAPTSDFLGWRAPSLRSRLVHSLCRASCDPPQLMHFSGSSSGCDSVVCSSDAHFWHLDTVHLVVVWFSDPHHAQYLIIGLFSNFSNVTGSPCATELSVLIACWA